MESSSSSSTNRFADSEDQPIGDTNVTDLLANCPKWTLKNDLELLTHLKTLSNKLITRTETTNQSVNSLVFNSKMHCVKVDNAINELQMLATSQFVENRVYDEAIEDIVAVNSVQSDEHIVQKTTKEENDILPKIKSALNIGLDFLSQRFDSISQQVPQNDSDDENDQIVEGLLSDTTKDEYSKRLLPYLIGSQEFFSDNYVGLGDDIESPTTVDIINPIDDDLQNEVISIESTSDDFGAVVVRSNTIVKGTDLIDHNLNDSDDEPTDIFGTIHQSRANHANHRLSSDDNDSDSNLFTTVSAATVTTTTTSTKEVIEDNDKVIEPKKPTFSSFHEQLSAVLSARNPDVRQNSVISDDNEEEVVKVKSKESIANKMPTNQTSVGSDSDTSDSDSIFNVNKNKPQIEKKPKPKPKPRIQSKLFANDSDDDDYADEGIFDKQKIRQQISETLAKPNKPKPTTSKITANLSNIFNDNEDDEDVDDLFNSITTNQTVIKPKTRTVVSKVVTTETPNIVSKSDNNKKLDKVLVINNNKKSLFDDDSDNDLFSVIAKKDIKTTTKVVDKSHNNLIEEKTNLFNDSNNENIVKKKTEKIKPKENPLFDDINEIKTSDKLEEEEESLVRDNSKKQLKTEEKSIVNNVDKESKKSEKKPLISKSSIFDSDDEEDDLFSFKRPTTGGAIDVKNNIIKKDLIHNSIDNEFGIKDSSNSKLKTTTDLLDNKVGQKIDSLFATIPQSVNNNKQTLHYSSESTESESNLFNSSKKVISSSDNTVKTEPKPMISSTKPSKPLSISDDDEDNDHEITNKLPTQRSLTLDSDSSDSDSIFTANKTRLTTTTTAATKSQKSINYSNLFNDNSDSDKNDNEVSIFGDGGSKVGSIQVIKVEQKVIEHKPIISTKPKTTTTTVNNVSAKLTNIFTENDVDGGDGAADDDDLFGKLKNNIISKSKIVENVISKHVSNDIENKKSEKPTIVKKYLFEDSDEDDLFGGNNINKKSHKIKESVVIVDKELIVENTGNKNSEQLNKITKEFTTNNKSQQSGTDVVTDDDFLMNKPIATLANDGLKHKAMLASKRNRRPPSMRLAKQEERPPVVVITNNNKTNSRSLFDSDDNDDDNNDLFSAKPSKAKPQITKPKPSSADTKPKTVSESSDLFEDPLFAMRF
ncbi:WASH complex subunit 2-like [Oppia nitens]|uniref:WASH complex subunit 2-like n=1 Tax=Oppia nitens TaxID=1686743 RepID=UPI0023DB29AE|nr:WASH complex subunit 2-like [Oppia nitens]